MALPIRPGAHSVAIHWRAPDGVSLADAHAGGRRGRAGVNAELALSPSADRWVLLVGGPRLGPAVLFWGLLVVAALAGLRRSPARGLTPLGVASWFLLFVGLSQVPIYLALVVAGWLLALGWRRDHAPREAGLFDLAQIALGFWTAAALACLIVAVQQGLLGLPEMQIAGNGSMAQSLHWYQDRSDAVAADGVGAVRAAPRLPPRDARVGALARAGRCSRWLRWGWESFSSGGAWRRPELRRRRQAPPPSAAPPA